ncbi:MAG: ABC transporter permease [Clostridia bacterium]|nr:ABC transporter permease [Clostridia bacterium]NCC68326.1 ABC transporter permease [Clostridia bacterium]
MIFFGIRNLKVFFKDRAAVFFSLLAVFIIIGLYALFLGDAWAGSFEGMTGVRFLMDSWIVAGLLAVASITTTMGAFGIMVDDRVKKINKDFVASPISSGSIVGGYILGAIVIGIIMSLATLVLSEIYIVANGGELMALLVLLKVLGLVVLSTVANSALVLFMVTFFNSSNAFATASTILGTLIGFLTGVYLPIGILPEAVQWIVKCFPVSHAAALFRQVIMAAPIAATFNGAPEQMVTSFEKLMGVRFDFGGTAASPALSTAILLVTAAVFYLLSLLRLSRKRR